MKRFSIWFLPLIIFSLFYSVFFLFQSGSVYDATLGKVTHTYQNIHGDIQMVNKPFTELTENSLNTWDASYYDYIRQNGYRITEERARAESHAYAFFPLFPLIWKFSGFNFRMISILNFVFFSIGLLILYRLFLRENSSNNKILLLIAFLFPSTVVFHIPYSEATMFICMSLAIAGIMRSNYRLYFIGAFLAANARSAVLIPIMSFLVLEFFLFLLRRTTLRIFIIDMFKCILPLFLGIISTALYQFYFTGSFTSFLSAQQKWGRHFSLPAGISDWSMEGFAISAGAVFFVLLPAILFCWRRFVSIRAQEKSSGVFHFDTAAKHDYLFCLSAIYLTACFLFALFFQDGSINSLQRYMLATPFFYIFFFLLPGYAQTIRNKVIIIAGLIILITGYVITTWAMNSHDWKWNFSMSGFAIMFLLMAASLFFSRRRFHQITGITVISILVLISLTFQAYLFNQFLCEGWMFV